MSRELDKYSTPCSNELQGSADVDAKEEKIEKSRWGTPKETSPRPSRRHTEKKFLLDGSGVNLTDSILKCKRVI